MCVCDLLIFLPPIFFSNLSTFCSCHHPWKPPSHLTGINNVGFQVVSYAYSCPHPMHFLFSSYSDFLIYNYILLKTFHWVPCVLRIKIQKALQPHCYEFRGDISRTDLVVGSHGQRRGLLLQSCTFLGTHVSHLFIWQNPTNYSGTNYS